MFTTIYNYRIFQLRVALRTRCMHAMTTNMSGKGTSGKRKGSSSAPPSKKMKVKNEDEAEASTSSNGVKFTDASKDFLELIRHAREAKAQSVSAFKFNKKRVRVLSQAQEFSEGCEGVVYWMSRDQRVQDNWAMLYAQRLALKLEIPLHVVFCLVPKFLEATIRQYGFMLKGLQEVEQECKRLGITFHLLTGYAKDVLPSFVSDNKIGGVVTDFSPLRVPKQWVKDVTESLPKNVPLCQVDAHNIVPCWEASDKREYGARTIRTKIQGKLPEYLTEFPPVITHPYAAKTKGEPVDWSAAEASLQIDRTVLEVSWAEPGSNAGHKMLETFCKERLRYFSTDRNNPNKNVCSNLSPWIHFGQISAQRCALVVKQFKSKFKEGGDAFIEESVIRRELSDNFCYYVDNYDSIECAYDWAKETLRKHASDKREYVYTCKQLEEGKTHDDLWNAAQIQMVKEGKMHGFLRMYWAKKILEWTSSPDEALKISLYLNDKYELDGRDPNGYVGCMWSICGIHDQGWGERPVFGKIRFMNYQGCKRKFDVPAFVRKYGGRKH